MDECHPVDENAHVTGLSSYARDLCSRLLDLDAQSHPLIVRILIVYRKLFALPIDKRIGHMVGAVGQLREIGGDGDGIFGIIQVRRYVHVLQLPGLGVDGEGDRVARFYVVLDNQAHSATAGLQRDVAGLFGLHQAVGIRRGVLFGERADLLAVLLVFLLLLVDDVLLQTALAAPAGCWFRSSAAGR